MYRHLNKTYNQLRVISIITIYLFLASTSDLFSQPIFSIKVGIQKRTENETQLTGFGSLNVGMKIKNIGAVISVWSFDKAFIGNGYITPDDIPTPEKFLRSESRLGSTITINYILATFDFDDGTLDLSPTVTEVFPELPDPDEEDNNIIGFAISNEIDIYKFPRNLLLSENEGNWINDWKIYGSIFLFRSNLGVILSGGIGTNDRLDHIFTLSDGQELRLKIRGIVQFPYVKDILNWSGFKGWLTYIAPYIEIEVDNPSKRFALFKGFENQYEKAERPSEIIAQFGITRRF